MVVRVLDSSGLGYGPIFVSYEHGNGTRISRTARQLSVSREGAAFWSYSVYRCSCIRGLDSNITPKSDNSNCTRKALFSRNVFV
jgi:hypothetical protein